MDIYIKKGKIHKLFAVDQKSDKFRKQEFVITEVNTAGNSTHTEYIKMQCINNKVDLLSDADPGDFVVIKFSIGGRKYVSETKGEMFFTNLDVEDLSIVHKSTKERTGIKAGGDTDYSDLIPGLDKKEEIKDIEDSSGLDDITNKEYNDLPF